MLPPPPTGCTNDNTVPALTYERTRATFPPRLMTYYLDGNQAKTVRREHFERLIINDSSGIFTKTPRFYSLTRPERYRASMRKQRRVVDISRELDLSPSDQRSLRLAVSDDLGTDLQNLMFIPNIASTFSVEQQAEWLPRAMNWDILGCCT